MVSATTAKLVMPRPANAPMVAKMVGLVKCVMNQFVMMVSAAIKLSVNCFREIPVKYT